MYFFQMQYVRKKRKALRNGKPEYIVLIKQWIHQGFTYLDKTERYYRIVAEIIPFSLCLYLFSAKTELSLLSAFIVSFLIAHTLNWIFNYNFWTCMTFTFPGIRNPGNSKTLIYLEKMQRRMLKYNSIGGCMLYGSISRGVWHEKSDLDMRILRQPGFFSGLKAYLIVFSERLIAVFYGQPLDLYLADSVNFLNKMRKDENPIFLKNANRNLFLKYKTTSYVDFKKAVDLNKIRENENIKYTLGL